MTNFASIFGLELRGILDRGIPNKERIVLRAEIPMHLGNFALICGPATAEGGLVPSSSFFLKLDGRDLKEGTWVIVYTCPGSTRSTTIESNGDPVLVLHWDKPNTIFHAKDWTVAAIEISGISVAPLPPLSDWDVNRRNH